MSIQLGQVAPDFEQDSSQGKIHFHQWLGNSWGVLFSHPADYTPICTTELGEVAHLRAEWDKRNVKTIAISVDTSDSHRGWIKDIDKSQATTVDYPILADPDRKVASLYDMVHPDADPTVTVRAVFVIDPNKKIRLILTYPPSIGRNFDEILRSIDALQLSDKAKIATPVNWRPGEKVVIPPSVSDADAKAKYPQGFDAKTPYLRYVDLGANA